MPGQHVTYFGDIEAHWAIDSRYKWAQGLGPVGAVIAASHDDGPIRLIIKDKQDGVREAFQAQTENSLSWRTNLLEELSP